MVLVEFETDNVWNINRVKSWSFIPKESSKLIDDIPNIRLKFNNTDIPDGFYKCPHEYYLYSDNSLKRHYVKKEN